MTELTPELREALWLDTRAAHPFRYYNVIFHMVSMRQTSAFSCRYEETDGHFDFRLYRSMDNDYDPPEDMPQHLRLPVNLMPSWLQDIVALGKVGGYAVIVRSPPPDVILWFGMDEHGKLTDFTDFEAV